mgnify:CR=1 FL=1
MIEQNYDISFIASLALREKQIQQNYRPIIAIHKWFARRPGTLFRGLLLSEFGKQPVMQSYFQSHSYDGIRIADPFMGGGTPLVEANRIGCEVIGYDINPMSYWIVRQGIQHLDLNAYDKTAAALRSHLEQEIGHLFRTICLTCGASVPVKYFLWAKTLPCRKCGFEFALFPGCLVAGNSRHPKNVILCRSCGELNEVGEDCELGRCSSCRNALTMEGTAKKGQGICPKCGEPNHFPNAELGPFKHQLFALEYYCHACKGRRAGRFFKKPDAEDLNKVNAAEHKWSRMRSRYVPDDRIPAGDETDRLHRWGYSHYRDMFNARQLLGLELAARFIAKISSVQVRDALATNFSDLLRYQNMLCRYDTMALKSLDIFSVHGFPVGLIQCESNFLGITVSGAITCIGSGGWANIIDKFRKAKAYCDSPFEVLQHGGKKKNIPMTGEWIGDDPNGYPRRRPRRVALYCQNAATADLAPASLDAVFTDPPYFGNVQYAELMDFCYVWLRKLLGKDKCAAFEKPSTRCAGELTGNENMGRGMEHFTEGLSEVFKKMAFALKPGAPLAFTYHHNEINAYCAVAVAILDANLTCSAALPCPAEMGASIHINGTGSSIVDTVFVCRTTGKVPRGWIQDTPEGVAQLVLEDARCLEKAGAKSTAGDLRCIAFGHLTRLAIWSLRHDWDRDDKTNSRIERVARWLQDFGGWPAVARAMDDAQAIPVAAGGTELHAYSNSRGEQNAKISF